MDKPTRTWPWLLACALALSVLCPSGWATDVPTRGPVVNLVEWNGGALPPVYERSDQLPLTAPDILQLIQNEFQAESVVRMVQERRFVGDASAEGLVALRRAGVAPQVIDAVSRHALPPNRAINLTVHLEFEGASSQARQRYLYVIVPDSPQERVFTANLETVLTGEWDRDQLVDASDPLLPRQIRRVTFSSRVPLKTYGEKTLQVLTSARPDIQGSADIPESDRPGIRQHRIDYPACSLQQECELRVRYKQDALLPYKWQMVASHLQCEWD